MMSGRLEHKVALVTGAARGQGRCTAVRLAQEGADIIALDICAQIGSVPFPMATRADLGETVKEVEALGRRIVASETDVRDLGAVERTVDAAVTDLGRLDAVSVNAGITSIGRADELTPLQWQDVIDVNLTGAWHTVRASIPHLRAGGRGGAIVITSSAAGLRAIPNMSHYVAAKHGVVGLMKALAIELGPEKIRVNTVNPYTVSTPMANNKAMYRLFRPDLENPTEDDFMEAMPLTVLQIPWVEPIDISNVIAFLVSDEARYITGVAVTVGNAI